MSPWWVLVPFAGALNLLLFVFIRGRWDALVPILALAALVGAMLGDVAGRRTGLELLRIGDFHFVAASVGAQLAMLLVTLLAALGPSRALEEGE
jgi:hypothetical protein